MSTKKLGLFIDLEIIQNTELDWVNKVLLAEIISLSKLEKGCFASNKWLSDFLQIKAQSIHRRIKFLVDNQYITTLNKYSGKKCIGRIITPTGKVMTAQADTMEAHASTIEAHASINDSTRFHLMTAESDPSNTFIKPISNTSIKPVTNTVLIQEKPSEELLDKYVNKNYIR
jgi:DNA-binding Lrp family transcriptional regulator